MHEPPSPPAAQPDRMMSGWQFLQTVMSRSYQHAREKGHQAHANLIFLGGAVLLVGVLVGFVWHLEHHATAIALPFGVLAAWFVWGLFGQSYAIYRELYEKNEADRSRWQMEKAALQKEAEERERQLEVKYEDQLAKLNASVEALTKQVDDRFRYRDIRNQVGRLLADGAALQVRCGDISQPAPTNDDISTWWEAVARYLDEALDSSFSVRFVRGGEKPHGSPPDSLRNAPGNRAEVWQRLGSHLARLEQLIAELPK